MATRIDIVNWAIWEANYDHWKPTDDEMKEIFIAAGLAAPSKGELNKFRTAPGNIVINGQSLAWCGIFATYVLKKWDGLDVNWVSGGIRGAGVNKTWGRDGMRPGDVAIVRGPLDKKGRGTHHHFVITEIDYAKNTLQSVDGNSTNNEIVWQTGKKIVYKGADDAPYTPYCHYKLIM